MAEHEPEEGRKMPAQKVLDELRELHREFLNLGTDVEELLASAVRAIQSPDLDGIVAVSAGDDARAERGHRIVERCRRIELLYQPVAVDFREVTAILRTAAELEHIGNLATEITARSVALAALPVSVPGELSRMAEAVSGMVRRFLDAYTLLDAVPVRSVAWTRAEVNGLAEVLTEWLVGAMRADPAAVEPGLNLFAVIQNLQRIAEHATALAEEVAFLTDAAHRFGTDHTVVVPREPSHASHAS